MSDPQDVPNPYANPAYGTPPPGLGYPTPGHPGGPLLPDHPQATTAMVLGIVALAGTVVCGLPILLAPFAWHMGAKAVREIDANPYAYGGRGKADAGRIMGIIGTILLGVGVLVIGGILVLGLAVSVSSNR